MNKQLRYILCFVGGISVSLAIPAAANYINQTTNNDFNCVLNAAAKKALDDKIRAVGMTSPDPGKYFNAGSPDSCIANISIANLDLSKLIPDPLGLLTGNVDGVIDSLKKAAIGTACTAVRSSITDTISKYNSAIFSINGGLNLQGQSNQLIDASIGPASRQVLDSYAMNWKSPTPTNATASVQISNAPLALPMSSGLTALSVPTPVTSPAANNTASPQITGGGLGSLMGRE